MKRRYIRAMKPIPHRDKAQLGDIICIAGALGDYDAKPAAEGEYLAHCQYVHAVTDLRDGVDAGIKRIMEYSGVSAEIQLEDLPFSAQAMQQYGSQLSRMYQFALHDGHFFELIATVHYKHFADLNVKYKKRFGKPLHAVGRIVEGDTTRVNYIENAFGAMPIGTPWEHFC